MKNPSRPLSDGEIHELKRWNTPTIYNGWEQIKRHNPGRDGVRWGVTVEVFGRKISPGQLIHADKHGFLAVPPGEEARLLEAAKFMDASECRTLLEAARDIGGRSPLEICAALDRAGAAFQAAAKKKFSGKGEW